MKKLLFIVLIAILTASSVGAQVSRTLKTQKNGFKWYETYEGGYFGAEDINGHTIIPLNRGYNGISFYVCEKVLGRNIPGQGHFLVSKKDEFGKYKYGSCDINGKEIIAIGRYDYIAFYSEKNVIGYYHVRLNGLYGACDIDGREIIAPKYKSLVYYDEEYHGDKFHCSKGFNYKDSQGNFIGLGITLDANGHASSYEGSSSSPAVVYTPPSNSTAPKSSTPSASTTTSPSKADVDLNIPQGEADKSNTYVFIIANEHYPQRNVPYAINDGEVFKQYCEKTLGIQSNHIRLYKDATTSNILACVENMKLASSANNGQLNIIFYYAGHAFPDERTKSAYLLPVDGEVTLLSTCYSLNSLYKALNSIKARSVVCFIDACFSGATRENEMLLAGRGVAIKPKDDVPQGNVVVFTSASGAETAHQYKDKNHGLFTYFLLKKLRDTKGSVTLGELGDYLTNEVKRTSFDVNNRIQTPTVIPSPTMAQKWRGLKL